MKVEINDGGCTCGGTLYKDMSVGEAGAYIPSENGFEDWEGRLVIKVTPEKVWYPRHDSWDGVNYGHRVRLLPSGTKITLTLD